MERSDLHNSSNTTFILSYTLLVTGLYTLNACLLSATPTYMPDQDFAVCLILLAWGIITSQGHPKIFKKEKSISSPSVHKYQGMSPSSVLLVSLFLTQLEWLYARM